MLIQAAFQTQEQAVIPLAQRIDDLLVDQDSIDNSAHHDDLLPVPTVPGEAPGLARGHSAVLSKAGFCHRPVKSSAGHGAGGGSTKVVIHRLDM
ncbi:hypothetical protein T190_11925 [Sinorhizobium meliloti CCBAU 01290]|uniref:hypothetical protein n=1 Tax=Rhizobium meliloti TaxID=382 RepID=UPI000C55C1B2|nr:hypothetical protein T190_11925 [Sinorhizobium meliloti CCBAU 01290]